MMADFANLQQKGAVPESTAQLIDVLFETTSCLKSQLEANRKTTTILLERANQLKVFHKCFLYLQSSPAL